MKKSLLLVTLTLLTVAAGSLIAREPETVPPPPAPGRPAPPDEAIAEARADAEIEANVGQVRKKLEAQRSQLSTATKQMNKAMSLAQAAPNSGGFSTRLSSIIRRGGSDQALIVPREAGDPKSMAEIEEDLKVMDHIVDKAAGSSEKGPHAMGIYVFNQNSSSSQNLYLEGYGAILFLNVNMPLMPPPAARDRQSDEKEKPNSEWEEARREMTRPSGENNPFVFEERFAGDWGGVPGMEYDADKVEELKKNLIAALKNAANIRRLKSDETVTVIVTGVNAPGQATPVKRVSGGGSGGSSSSGKASEDIIKMGGKPGSRPAKLVIRAKKSDAEAFQNGKLNFDDFRKKVTVMIY